MSANLGALKLAAIDTAVRSCRPATSADLGGVWGVDGGYSLYAVDHHGIERAAICDFEFTARLRARAEVDDRIELIQGDFTGRETADRIGHVDMLLMFDVLLHQVKPDWDEVLRRYAHRADCIVLAGPWWRGDETVRLLDLGPDRYLDLVPIREFHEPIVDNLDAFNEERGRPWRDCQDIWQWGITDKDLRTQMAELGFRLVHHEGAGRWRGLASFDDRSYVFVSERSVAEPCPRAHASAQPDAPPASGCGRPRR